MINKIIIILLLSLIISSCTNTQKENLISKIETENTKLKDSIKRLHEIFQTNQKIGLEITNPYKKSDSSFIVTGKFYIYRRTEPYNVFLIRNGKRILIKENQTTSEFRFNFIPESLVDSIIKVEADFKQRGGMDLTHHVEYNIRK